MKIGRNAPCPCGSGKKYKHCCLSASAGSAPSAEAAASASAAPASEDLLVWRRVRRALDGLPMRMLKFTSDVYGQAALHEAWAEFWLWTGEDEAGREFDPASPFTPLFMSWFFHRWTPDVGTQVEDPSLRDRSPTAEFLRRRGARIEPVLRRYLEGCLDAPFSFHEIVHAERGRGFGARDVLTGEERRVIEKSATEHMQAGDILYGQLVEVDGIGMVEASSPVLLPPIDKIEVMGLRTFVAKQLHAATPRERLIDMDGEIRDVYLALANRALYPSRPQLHNTDGELVELQRLVFDVDSAEAAFHALKHLSVTESEDELLAAADLDADGRIARVEIAWGKAGNALHASWTNTTLGRIEISGTRLIGEVNSAQRAQALKRIVEEALGERARYRATEIQSLEQASGHADEQTRARDDASDELAELPEVKAHIRQHMATHYENWVSEEIPALGGRTPLAAVADPEGREKVEALLCEFERGAERMGLDAELLQGVRRRLGLAEGPGTGT